MIKEAASKVTDQNKVPKLKAREVSVFKFREEAGKTVVDKKDFVKFEKTPK